MLRYLEDIYSHHSNVRKATAYLPMIGEDVGWTILTTIDKQVHHGKRKVVSAMLSAESLARFETHLIRHYENNQEFLDVTSTRDGDWSGPVAMHDFRELTIDTNGNDSQLMAAHSPRTYNGSSQ